MASETRTLQSSPSILPLYARAAAPLVPGLSLLPFVPGGGGEIPEIELELPNVRADVEAVAAYARVCGFALRDQLPPTYPHVLAFPLHMALMADGRFPFGAVGLVHVENRIAQHRPLGLGEELTLRARPTALLPHPKGKTFTIVSEARTAGGELAWEGVSTFLRSGKSDPDAVVPATRGQDGDVGGGDLASLPASAEWKLGGDLGRRYAAVSADRNPIHMHALTAKPLGFPAAIAHGMWTKARCLAALGSRLPDAFAVEVRFRKPILLPARVEFASAPGEAEGEIEFAVRDARKATPHLDGRITPEHEPTASKAKSKPRRTK
ncbi:MAG: MaoC/PaaZ C-terminal domain-containing protein [Solirubrobacterales bacterium]